MNAAAVPAIILLACASCRVNFDNLFGDDDGSVDGIPCALGPWSTPVNIIEINSSAVEVAPALSPDRKTIVFTRGGSFLFYATRSSPSDAFAPPQALYSNVPYFGPTWNPAGDRLLFNDPADQLFEATFDGTRFGAATAIPDLSGTPVQSPSLSADGRELFFGDNVNSQQIWRSTRPTPNDPWGPAQPISELDTTYYEGWPSISGDGLTLYYESTMGGSAVWTATRPSIGAFFENAMKVSDLNIDLIKTGDPSVSHDGRTIVFASDRTPTAGAHDIWISTRDCL